MAHEAQVRYSDLVLAKIRKENKLKNGVVFNTDYEHISLCSKMICVHFYFSHERRLHISVGRSESALLPINL